MSSNMAMAAKARAMFGARLGKDEYEQLLQKKSLDEVVTYLKSSTLYRSALEGANEKAIHRGQLEVLLRQSLFDRIERLLRYGSKDDAKFLFAAAMNTEIDLILACVRSLMNPSSTERSQMIAGMPIYVSEYLSFNMASLARVQTWDELVDLLKPTRYKNTIERYKKNALSEINYVSLEHELRDQYYDDVLQMANENVTGKDQNELIRMIKMHAELNNIAMIYRMKKYFQSAPEDIHLRLSPHTCLFSEKEIETLIDQADSDEIIAALEQKYHHYIRNNDFSYIENYVERIVYNINYSMIETKTEAHLVMMSYMGLSQAEIKNVINICEGIRYHISSDRIRALLVY